MKNDLAIFKKILSRYKLWNMFRNSIKFNLKLFNESNSNHYIIDKILYCIIRYPKNFIYCYAQMRNIMLTTAIYSILDTLVPDWTSCCSTLEKGQIIYQLEMEWRKKMNYI